MNEFLKWHHDDPWNEALICRIVELAGVDIAMVPSLGNSRAVVKPVSQSSGIFAIGDQTKGAIATLKKFFGFLLGRVMKRERVVIVRSGLSFWQYARLNLKLRQIPSFSYTQEIPLARSEVKERSWHLSIKVDAAGNVSPQFIKNSGDVDPKSICRQAMWRVSRPNRLEAQKSRLSGQAQAIYSINRWMNDEGFRVLVGGGS